MFPSITWKIIIWKCNRNRTVQVQCCCYFAIWEKLLLFLATIMRRHVMDIVCVFWGGQDWGGGGGEVGGGRRGEGGEEGVEKQTIFWILEYLSKVFRRSADGSWFQYVKGLSSRNSWRHSDLWWFPWILHRCVLDMLILYYVHVQKQHFRKQGKSEGFDSGDRPSILA